ncbi:hypothetical protein DEU56DRAFT_905025 [Suillus clintonianus]|uniref:uncharacterized protein n=1 Tax=Suillus clintonianus TaxID=1904413 RepID=UPI001B86DE52|nr:uncharacterized protein DEU56DRAFT_905025 [Suillus clintonianus]KAG2118378.1 hypothetical protein DEU56DRAFT_905025 [Suillus clintonianus]
MDMSTVCRDEQHPYCTVTFYTSESSSVPSITSLLIAFLVAIRGPRVVCRMLKIYKSDSGLAATQIPPFLAPSLIAVTMLWMLEWADSARVLEDTGDGLKVTRTVLARTSAAVVLICGVSACWTSEKPKLIETYHPRTLIHRATILSSDSSQLPGRPLLKCNLHHPTILTTIYLANDNINRELSFLEIVPRITAQATKRHFRLQENSAFVCGKTVFPSFTFSLAINMFGSFLLLALAVPLIILQNLPPIPHSRPTTGASMLRAALTMSLYSVVLEFGAAVCGAALRRHLTAWKVFAPRCLGAVFELCVFDFGVSVGVRRIEREIRRVFRKVGFVMFNRKHCNPSFLGDATPPVDVNQLLIERLSLSLLVTSTPRLNFRRKRMVAERALNRFVAYISSENAQNLVHLAVALKHKTYWSVAKLDSSGYARAGS